MSSPEGIVLAAQLYGLAVRNVKARVPDALMNKTGQLKTRFPAGDNSKGAADVWRNIAITPTPQV